MNDSEVENTRVMGEVQQIPVNINVDKKADLSVICT